MMVEMRGWVVESVDGTVDMKLEWRVIEDELVLCGLLSVEESESEEYGSSWECEGYEYDKVGWDDSLHDYSLY